MKTQLFFDSFESSFLHHRLCHKNPDTLSSSPSAPSEAEQSPWERLGSYVEGLRKLLRQLLPGTPQELEEEVVGEVTPALEATVEQAEDTPPPRPRVEVFLWRTDGNDRGSLL